MGECGGWKRIAEAVEGIGIDRPGVEELLEELKRCFVLEVFGEGVEEAKKWVGELSRVEEAVVKSIGAKGVLLSKEMRSFVRDPFHHLVKKLFIYAHDLARGKLSVEEFSRVAEAAVRTSLRTNLRSVYEAWVFLGLIFLMGGRGARIVFPEHAHILFERSGRQRGGSIPPNVVLHLEGRGYISFFVEAPRPIGWGDSRDLSSSWKLYTALRPDFLLYRGMVLDIVRINEDPPIVRPDVVIECKELSDWYTRIREVRGPFARTLTAEEWRRRWIRGLWAGLADVLGLERAEDALELAKKKRGVRLSEPQIVKLYAKVYRPERLFLVSRTRIPGELRRELEDEGVVVIDDVGFRLEALEPLADEISKYIDYRGSGYEVIRVPAEVAQLLDKLAKSLGVDRASALAVAVREAVKSLGAGGVGEEHS